MQVEQLASDAGQIKFDSETFRDVDAQAVDTRTEASSAGEPEFAYTLASNPYGHYCIPDSMADRQEAVETANAGIFQQATLELVSRKMGRGDLVMCRAGLGSALPVLHDALAPTSVIHALEPYEPAFAAARFTAQLNGLENLQLHQAFAGKRNRDVPATRVLSEEDALDGDTEHTVKMNRLDKIIPAGRYVSVIYLNSGGREVPAVLGATRTVHDCAPMIVMNAPSEQIRRFQASCLDAHFPDLRYTYAGMMDGNAIYVALNRA
ncbi:MAG: hypothetical protein AB3N23_01975 [Paracoccaceae bacterium]